MVHKIQRFDRRLPPEAMPQRSIGGDKPSAPAYKARKSDRPTG